MQTRQIPRVGAAILLASASFGQQAITAADRRCATPPFDPLRFSTALGVASDCAYFSTNPQPQYAPGDVYTLQVVVHVLQNNAGTGFISPADVQGQIDILNEDFGALPGSNGAFGFDTGIRFELATVDPQGNPTTGITYTTNNSWFNDSGNYWSTLSWDTDEYVNIYTNTAGGFLGYVPDIAQGVAGSNQDRIVVAWDTFGPNGPIGFPFNEGRTATHEVGHYLGLFHTFDGGCGSASACYTSGDLICDTNRQANPTSGCPSNPQSCGSPDPSDNYMDYSNDICMQRFTQEQANRMRCTLENWRPQIFTIGDGGGPMTGDAISINVDIGGAPNPGSGYGAAAGESGTWNSFSGTGSTSLVGVDGLPSGASLSVSGGNGSFSFDNAATSGNAEDLLDDLADAGNSTWTFSNLASGTYDVYLYSWAPDDPAGFLSNLTVVGGANGTQQSGGANWSGNFVLGTHYVTDTVNVSNGTLTINVGQVGGNPSSLNGIQLALVEDQGGPTVFCSAGTTSNGCSPSISASGVPSASSNFGFDITVDNVEGAQFGVIFYGISGAAQVPWGSGSSFLCVSQPVERTGVQNAGGGSGTCNGTLTLDWNTYVFGNSGAVGVPFSPGDMVWAQGWFRDPFASLGSNLSDGIMFTVGL